MDGRRFDRLTMLLSDAAGSRRNALAICSGGLAALLGLLGEHSPIEAGHDGHHKRKQRKKRRRHKKKKRCKKRDSPCNVNRPSQCCSKKCCFDSTSKSTGTCPSTNGECCGDRPFGGYCPQEFPQCCGSNACCGSSQTCCVNIGGRGVCCNPGFECTFDGSGCQAVQNAADVQVGGHGIARMHARG